MKRLLLCLALISSAAFAEEIDPKHYKIIRETVTEIPRGLQKNNRFYKNFDQVTPDPIENAGKVIGVAKDIVALGEDVYQLVIKGKPTNTTTYAPISVVPKVGSEVVDPLEMENWSEPTSKTFEAKFYNAYNVAVVTFRYSVMYSYRGSYDGKGAYLTAVQVIPTYVRTLFGFDFTATMKLGGVQNQGTKEKKVAGALLLIEYTVSSVMNKINRTDRFFVTGNGSFKQYQR